MRRGASEHVPERAPGRHLCAADEPAAPRRELEHCEPATSDAFDRRGLVSTGALDRREFVSACALAVAGLAFGGCASLVTRTVTPVDGRLELAFAHYPELAEPGGSLRVLPAGERDPVYILALADGTFAALSPICTHLGCTVDIAGDRLVCPCHGSTYDRHGAVLQGPAERALSRFRTSITPDGVLVVDLRSRA